MKNWAWQLTHPNESLPGEVPYANKGALIESVKESLAAGIKVAGKAPTILVIGAVGFAFLGFSITGTSINNGIARTLW